MNDKKTEQNVIYEQSAMAVVICDGMILCTVEEIYGKLALSLPKGHVEQGESVVEAAIRECFEETDVRLNLSDVVKELQPFSVTFTNLSGQIVCKQHCPVMFQLERQQTPSAKERRILEAKYMSIDDFIRDCSYDNVREIVREARK